MQSVQLSCAVNVRLTRAMTLSPGCGTMDGGINPTTDSRGCQHTVNGDFAKSVTAVEEQLRDEWSAAVYLLAELCGRDWLCVEFVQCGSSNDAGINATVQHVHAVASVVLVS